MDTFRLALFTGNYNHIKDGVSLTLNRLVRFLESEGIEVLIFGPTIKKPVLEHAGNFVTVPSVAMPGREEYRISLFFPEVLQFQLDDFDPHIIHIATPDLLGFAALRYARKRNIPVVTSYHTHFPSYLKYYSLDFLEPVMWKYLSWFYQKCEKVLVPTQSMLKYLKSRGFDEQLTIWSRGVDTELFNPGKRSVKWRNDLGIKDNEIILSFVSRLAWEKDLRTVIETCKVLSARSLPVRFVIAGDGPAMKEMQKELSEAIFVGHQSGEDLARVYASSDIFIFPSDTETFGNVTLEALSSGVPAIVANAVGSSSIVVHGESGYIAEPHNAEEFAEWVAKLIEDDELRKRMSRQARLRAKTFEWDDIMNGLLADYNDVLQK